MKTNKIFLASVFLLVGLTACAQYEEAAFYSKLVKGDKIVRTELASEVNYIRISTETDIEVQDFDSSLLHDSIEIKCIVVQKRTWARGNHFYTRDGKIVYDKYDTLVMLVGLRFKTHNKWIPFNHPLFSAYLKTKNPQLEKKYKKYQRHQEPTAGIIGIVIMGGALMVDGFLLFGWHPFFVPVYAAGFAVAGVGFVIHLANGRPYVLRNIIDEYNKA